MRGTHIRLSEEDGGGRRSARSDEGPPSSSVLKLLVACMGRGERGREACWIRKLVSVTASFVVIVSD